MRAVVTTDALQIIVMFISVVLIAILGTIYYGGLIKVFETSDAGGRIIYDK